MSSVVFCIDTVRDTLRSYLTDLYLTAGGSRSNSSYIFGDEPISNDKYPQIQILQAGDTPSPEILDIGMEYMVRKRVFLNVWIYTKNGFKVTVDGTEYVNARLLLYYRELVEKCLKSHIVDMDALGARDYHLIKEGKVNYDSSTQLYNTYFTICLEYFTREI